MTADMHEVRKLAADLGRVSAGIVGDVEKVAKKGAQNVKQALQADASGSAHFSQIAGSISYDRKLGLRSVGYEIGPEDDGGAGELANIFYFGGSHGGGGTGDIDGPLSEEEPRFMEALGKMGVERLTSL